MYNCGLLTISDSCFYNNSEDKSGPVLRFEISKLSYFKIVKESIVPDDFDLIKETLLLWSKDNIDLIITTGGTGCSERDVTPEVTRSVVNKLVPGISEAILIESLKITKFAMLSRGVTGILNGTLIINLPGSPKATKECLEVVLPVLKHALDQISGKKEITSVDHQQMQHKFTTKVNTTNIEVLKRPRKSPYEILNIDDAVEIVMKYSEKLITEFVDSSKSLNRILAQEVYSKLKVPPYPASIKDGYAVKYHDGKGPRTVIDVVNAGDSSSNKVIEDGTCSRISTGAALPKGADSVVKVEDTELLSCDDNYSEHQIDIKVTPIIKGQDVRPAGNDLDIDDVVLGLSRVGTTIDATDIGVMAMGGIKKVLCVKQPIVGVLSTGNELTDWLDLGDKIEHIVDCNRPLLISLYQSNYFTVIDLGIVKDDPQTILDVLLSAFQKCDVLITTGGVSMGEKDYLKMVLEKDLKATVHFGRVFMKPGKPTSFSTIQNENTNGKLKLIFSLPGNPVSAFVTSHLFVLPSLKKMSGYAVYRNEFFPVSLMHSITLDPRPEYRRGRLFIINKSLQQIQTTQQIKQDVVDMALSENCYQYEVSCAEFGSQMSSRLSSCVGANVLIHLPSSTLIGSHQLSAGSIVQAMRI